MKGSYVDVLDHGLVRLVDYMGGDLSVVQSARVSYNADWRAGKDTGSDARLINFLWENQHLTPFESVVFTFEVQAPIFVLRQWRTHRTQSANEVSARYSALPEEFYVPAPEDIGASHPTNKQARLTPTPPELVVKRSGEVAMVRDFMKLAFDTYHTLLEEGWPRELARTVLPVSTYSRMFTTMNLRNLLHFISLRNDPHAQHEIRVYAAAMLDLIRPIVPITVEAFERTPR